MPVSRWMARKLIPSSIMPSAVDASRIDKRRLPSGRGAGCVNVAPHRLHLSRWFPWRSLTVLGGFFVLAVDYDHSVCSRVGTFAMIQVLRLESGESRFSVGPGWIAVLPGLFLL